jgi:hypothetical protein
MKFLVYAKNDLTPSRKVHQEEISFFRFAAWRLCVRCLLGFGLSRSGSVEHVPLSSHGVNEMRMCGVIPQFLT